MKNKLSIEYCEDDFLNLFQEGMFIRAFEYSALKINNLFGYKIFPNIDKKTGFVYIEAAFPVSTKDDAVELLSVKNYKTRIYDNEGKNIFGDYPIQEEKDKLNNIKKELINF